MTRTNFLLLPFVLLAACGGGGGNSGSASGAPLPNPLGSVHVVLDTATGSDALVQFQVAAAFLERGDGSTTGNLLPAATMVTLADPIGEAAGLVLRAAPTGAYANLHLVLAPGSGTLLRSDGSTAAIAAPADLVVPIFDGLQHDGSRRSWLEVAHLGAPPNAGTWQPRLQARADGGSRTLAALRVAASTASAVTAIWTPAADGPLGVEFAANCRFLDDDGAALGGAAAFLTGLGASDDLVVAGRLFRDGTFACDQVQRQSRNDQPRLLGRITAIDPLQRTFWLDVFAEVRRGERRLLATARPTAVAAATARLHRHGERLPAAFGDLAVGQVAKVEWRSSSTLPNNLPQVVATEIEFAGPGTWAPLQPEWEGRVLAVDTQLGTITVVPRGNDPIVVQGQNVAQATVTVDANTYLERRQRQGGARSRIALDAIVAGGDRIWWRGTVDQTGSIQATWVRVRDDS